MPYSDWTLEAVQKTFHLETSNTAGIFSDAAPVPPSAHLTTALERNVPLAFAMGTEKAKSELIISVILVELWEHFDRRISFFSGVDFNVDPKSGLTGVCDFLVSLSPAQFHVEAPVIVILEAKRDNLTIGLGQCVAEMVAAQRFNAERGNNVPCVYGATTSGIEWVFLKLEGKRLQLDMAAYTIERCDNILGILANMVDQKA